MICAKHPSYKGKRRPTTLRLCACQLFWREIEEAVERVKLRWKASYAAREKRVR